MAKCRCYICNDEDCNTTSNLQTAKYFYMRCQNCGSYVIPQMSPYLVFGSNEDIILAKEKLSHYLFYNNRKRDLRIIFIGEEDEFNQFIKDEPHAPIGSIIHYVDSSQIENWYPKTFTDKINYVILKLK